jgi:5-methylcytosine-specific restriction endonuclease McrBC regulatory subunit McrC
MGWIYDERGLGGGRELDGLAWQLPLDRAWEAYVEAITREDAARTGGHVKVARLGETLFPLLWTDSLHRSLGHLEPDIVVQRGRFVQIVDAKYKAHLAELDEHGWRQFADEARGHHRADVHQVLAYAALFDADHVKASLVYPLRLGTYTALAAQGKDRSLAELTYGGRRVELELRGLPFGQER